MLKFLQVHVNVHCILRIAEELHVLVRIQYLYSYQRDSCCYSAILCLLPFFVMRKKVLMAFNSSNQLNCFRSTCIRCRGRRESVDYSWLTYS